VGADCGGAVSDNPARLLALKAAAIFLNTRDWSVEQLEREFRKTLHEQPSPPAVPDAERVDVGALARETAALCATQARLHPGGKHGRIMFGHVLAALDQQQREIERVVQERDHWMTEARRPCENCAAAKAEAESAKAAAIESYDLMQREVAAAKAALAQAEQERDEARDTLVRVSMERNVLISGGPR
jgi:hypothetical protein